MTFQKKNYIDYLPNCYLGHLPVWHRYYIRYEKSPKLTISIEKAPICNGSCRRCNNNHKFIITNQSTHPKHHNVSLTCNKKKTIISTQQISNRTWKKPLGAFFRSSALCINRRRLCRFPPRVRTRHEQAIVMFAKHSGPRMCVVLDARINFATSTPFWLDVSSMSYVSASAICHGLVSLFILMIRPLDYWSSARIKDNWVHGEIIPGLFWSFSVGFVGFSRNNYSLYCTDFYSWR